MVDKEAWTELDMIDIIRLIERRKGKFLALLMADIEVELANDPEKFKLIRKLVFDYFNDFTRSVNRVLVGGDVEG